MLIVLRLGWKAGMALVIAFAWILGRWLDHNGFVIGAYSILAMKFHLFAAGMLIAMSTRGEARTKWLYLIAACAVIFVPLGGGRDAIHRAIKTGIVLGFFALIYRGMLPRLMQRAVAPLDMVLANPMSRFIGDVSYGVYLIHLLVMIPVCGWLATAYPAMAPFPRFWAALALVIPITYSLAYAAYRLVELPGISWGRQVAARFQKPKPAPASA
jgi:peptidoglycan/LPS O-acetylase OafA/YrhL